MKYRHIFFDIDDTLIDFRKSFHKAALRTIEYGGGVATDEAAEKFFKYNDERWYGLRLNQIEDMQIRTDYHRLYGLYLWEAIDEARKGLGLKGDSDALLVFFLKAFGECATLNPNVVETLEKLRKECKVYVASNGLNCLQPGKLHEIEQLFDKVYISENVRHIKPEKEFFDYVLTDLGCEASECLMVGDSLPNDIAGANNAGIDSCFFNPRHRECGEIKPTYMIEDFAQLIKITE